MNLDLTEIWIMNYARQTKADASWLLPRDRRSKSICLNIPNKSKLHNGERREIIDQISERTPCRSCLKTDGLSRSTSTSSILPEVLEPSHSTQEWARKILECDKHKQWGGFKAAIAFASVTISQGEHSQETNSHHGWFHLIKVRQRTISDSDTTWYVTDLRRDALEKVLAEQKWTLVI